MQLFDTRCDSAARLATTDHATRDTSQAGAACTSSGSRPDLMGLTAIPGAASDPNRDYSNDITRAMGGGLTLMRDSAAGDCTSASSLSYTSSEASTRKRSVHTWASTASTAAFQTPATGGRGSLTLWTSTADGQQRSGRLCIVLRRASTGQVLGSSDFSLVSWPDRPTQLTISFDVAQLQAAAGERLLLTLRVPSDSGDDLSVLYDHAAYASNLSLTTVAGSEFK
jgi:hypothetical protein